METPSKQATTKCPLSFTTSAHGYFSVYMTVACIKSTQLMGKNTSACDCAVKIDRFVYLYSILHPSLTGDAFAYGRANASSTII